MPSGVSGIPSATERGPTSAARSCRRPPTSASPATTICSRSAAWCWKPTSTPTRPLPAGGRATCSTTASRSFIGGLEPQARLEHAELFHASARDPVWEYVLGGESALATFELTESPLVLVGHSHVPFAIALEGGELSGAHAPGGTEIDLAPGSPIVQPRLGRAAEGRRLARGLAAPRSRRRARVVQARRVRRAGDAGGDSRRGPAGLARRAARLRGLEPRRGRSRRPELRSPPCRPRRT